MGCIAKMSLLLGLMKPWTISKVPLSTIPTGHNSARVAWNSDNWKNHLIHTSSRELCHRAGVGCFTWCDVHFESSVHWTAQHLSIWQSVCKYKHFQLGWVTLLMTMWECCILGSVRDSACNRTMSEKKTSKGYDWWSRSLTGRLIDVENWRSPGTFHIHTDAEERPDRYSTILKKSS